MQSLVPFEHDKPREYIGSENLPHHNSTAWIEKALDLFFRRKWIIAGCFLVVLAVMVFRNLNQDPQYTANSYVMVDLGKTSVDLSRMSDDSEQPGVNTNLFVKNDRSISGELFLLRISEQLEQSVIQRLKEERSERADISSLSSDGSSSGDSKATHELYSLGKYVEFNHERESDNIIRITGISPIPEQALDIANFYAEEYVRLTQEANRAHLSSLRQSLEAKEKQRLYELGQIEKEIQEYLPQVSAAGLSQKATNLASQIATLEMQRDETNIQLQLKKSMLDTLMIQIETINPTLVRRISSGLDRQINAFQDQRAELEASKSQILLANPSLRGRENDNATLRQLNEQIEQLDSTIDSLSREYIDEAIAARGVSREFDGLASLNQMRQKVAELQIEINELNVTIDIINSRISGLQEELENLPDLASELARLERSRLHAEEMYQYVVERLQETRIAEESDPGYAQLIRAARAPRFSPGSSLPRSVLFGGFLGLLLGIVLAVAIDRIDNRIYRSDFFQSKGLLELGTIPDMNALIKESHDGQAYFQQNGQQLATSLVTISQPKSVIAEAYRNLRNTIHSSILNMGTQSILVTSPGEMEGKSTTAANLAIVMAHYGYKTLLIDADLHRPRIGKLFDLDREPGLMSVLLEDTEIDLPDLSTCVHDLSVLTAGKRPLRQTQQTKTASKESDSGSTGLQPVHASDLLGSKRMKKLLVEMKETFDVILIDSSPILAASDAALLSTLCDGVILVARAGKTNEGDLEYASNVLNKVGANILGVLLNGFDISMAYGLRYRYQNYMKYNYYS